MNKRLIKKKLGKKCVYCGSDNPIFLTIDHKLPKSRGGTDDENNLQLCCVLCNQLKTNHTDAEYKRIYKAYKTLFDMKMLHIDFKDKNGLSLFVTLKHNFHPDFQPMRINIK